MDNDTNDLSAAEDFSTAVDSCSGTATAPPPLEAESCERASNEHREHLDYLKRVSTLGNPPPISLETARLARIAWFAIWSASDSAMPVPAACTGPDGAMFYSWDKGRHHLELEIIPGKVAEFFYRDRETGTLWGEDYTIGNPLPPEIIEKFVLFV